MADRLPEVRVNGARGITAFGPSLVDLSARLSPRDFRDWCTTLGAGPGEWRAVPDRATVNHLIGRLVGAPVPPGHEFAALTAPGSPVVVSAGSSTLGMLSAMPERWRRRATYVSALAAGDPFSAFFTAAVEDLRVAHSNVVAPGHNPVSFVVYAADTPDRVLATYAGVTATAVPPVDPDAELLLVDTYELRAVHELIHARQVPVGLSLGNAGILSGALRPRIRGYLDDGLLTMIFGNAAEYRALFPEVPVELATVTGFRNHPVRRSVRFCLLTDGERGLAAHCDLDFARADAQQAVTVVNTSGAGDTAAGAFVAGVLDGLAPAEILARCAELAARVLAVPGSRIVG